MIPCNACNYSNMRKKKMKFWAFFYYTCRIFIRLRKRLMGICNIYTLIKSLQPGTYQVIKIFSAFFNTCIIIAVVLVFPWLPLPPPLFFLAFLINIFRKRIYFKANSLAFINSGLSSFACIPNITASNTC